jgi:hypothetical protein
MPYLQGTEGLFGSPPLPQYTYIDILATLTLTLTLTLNH